MYPAVYIPSVAVADEETSEEINGAIVSRKEPITAPISPVQVDSIDEPASSIDAAGGEIVVQKVEIPNDGFVGYVRDTGGNVLGSWK